MQTANLKLSSVASDILGVTGRAVLSEILRAASRRTRLHLAFLAAGIGPDHEVIMVPFTFVATVAAIRYTGSGRSSWTSIRSPTPWMSRKSRRPYPEHPRDRARSSVRPARRHEPDHGHRPPAQPAAIEEAAQALVIAPERVSRVERFSLAYSPLERGLVSVAAPWR